MVSKTNFGLVSIWSKTLLCTIGCSSQASLHQHFYSFLEPWAGNQPKHLIGAKVSLDLNRYGNDRSRRMSFRP
jgi:hypothetical protein